MFDLWLCWPRWVRAGLAASVLVYPAYLLSRGIIWPWGLAAGGTLLALSLPGTLAPPPDRVSRWRPPSEP